MGAPDVGSCAAVAVSFAKDTKEGVTGTPSMPGDDLDAVTQMLRNTDQPLDAPIKDVKDKWRLLPAFLKMRGLTKQHIDSFNYFLNVDIKTIVMANNRITCDADQTWYLEYTDIRIGPTNVDLPETAGVSEPITPQQCRLRDMTYSAQILGDKLRELSLGKQNERVLTFTQLL